MVAPASCRLSRGRLANAPAPATQPAAPTTKPANQGQSVTAAQVNVNYTVIKSPVTGRVGVRLVDPGNLVSTTDTTGIITINEVTPIAVTFTIPEGDFQRLANASQGFRKSLLTEALSQETNVSQGTGQLSVTDNHVDASTGTVQMKAKFANIGGEPLAGSVAEFSRLISEDTEKWAKVVRAAGLKPE